MNKIRSWFPWLQLILVFIVFVIVLSFAIIYRDQLKEAVLIPLLYLLWVGDLALKSFDQQCIWLLALFSALFLSLAYSRRAAKKSFGSTSHATRSRPLSAGRIHFWKTQVRVSSSKVYARTYRRSELRRLVIKTLAYRENHEDEQIKEQIRSRQLRVPAEVSYVLGVDDQPVEPDQSTRFIQRIQQRFNWIIERFNAPTFTPDPRLEKVAEYLESLMEVDNDTGNR